MADSHKNFAYSLVATAPSPASSGTSLVVSAGQGALFPAVPFNATIWPTGVNPISTNAEIIRVTAIATDTLTIVRAQEGSAARTVVVGDQIAATITALTLTDAETSYILAAYGLLGSVIKAEPVNGSASLVTATGLAISNQVLRLMAVYLPKAATLTGVKWYQITAGDYTSNNYNGVGLYTYSGGTLTLVASSTDDGNIWKATAGVASKAFTSTYVAAAGLYFIGFLYCRSAQVTNPSLGVLGAAIAANIAALDYTNSAKMNGSVSTQTSLPASQAMTGVTAQAQTYYFALY